MLLLSTRSVVLVYGNKHSLLSSGINLCWILPDYIIIITFVYTAEWYPNLPSLPPTPCMLLSLYQCVCACKATFFCLQEDEMYAAREKQAKLWVIISHLFANHDISCLFLCTVCREEAISLKSEWNESLEKVAAIKRRINAEKMKQHELSNARKASILVSVV